MHKFITQELGISGVSAPLGDCKHAKFFFFHIHVGDGRLECQGSAFGFTANALTLEQRGPGFDTPNRHGCLGGFYLRRSVPNALSPERTSSGLP